MADAIDFSKTQRILLLIDLNPLLQSPNPNPNYITSVLTTSNILLSFHPLSSSLFSFKLFFSSLSPLLTASLLPSASLSFNSPSQTLEALSNTLNSISFTQLPSSPPNCAHTLASLLQLVRSGYDWESDIDKSHPDGINVPSNLVILLSPVCKSLKSLAEFMCVDVNDNRPRSLDGYRAIFRDCFSAVSDAFNHRDIHFCWVDVCSREGELEINEFEQESALIGSDIRKFGWGFCSADSIILGSALVSFGLIYPNIVVSSKLLNSCRLDNTNRGHLNLEISDVSGKPLECKLCDLELLHLKGSSSKPRFNDITRTWEVGSSKAQHLSYVNNFLGSLNDGIMKLHVTAVQKYTKYENSGEFSSEFFIVRSAESGKKGKDGLDNIFADRVLEVLAGESSEIFEKKTVPTWQIFLNFLYREGYWASLSVSNSNGDSYRGILKPFTIHSAVLLLLDNNHYFGQNSGGTNPIMIENFPQGDTDFQKGTSSSGKYVHVHDGKRRKMKKQTYQDLTWSSFCKAAYEFSDVDLAEVYFANGLKISKKLKFLKCWMKEVKKHISSLNNMPHVPCQRGSDSDQQTNLPSNIPLIKVGSGKGEMWANLTYSPGDGEVAPNETSVSDSNQQKETNVNDSLTVSYGKNNELFSMYIYSNQPRMRDDAALVSCPETLESFFGNLPRKIQLGLESDGVDLKILAERLVNSSIHWLRLKHSASENVDESCTVNSSAHWLRLKHSASGNVDKSCTVQVAEIIKLLLREPKDLIEHKDDNPSSTSEHLVREYELQILLRLEILQSEYARSIKGSVKMKLVKQICSLLEIIQYLVEGGFRGDVSLYDYVERTIRTRYSHNLGDVVDKIYDKMDLLPFGEENEDQATMFNSEDSNQSWRDKHDTSASRMIQDSLSLTLEDESCHQLEKINECETKEDQAQKLNEARERRERARRYGSFTSRMPDLQRVWAPKPMKVKPEPKRKKHRSVTVSYSSVCETPFTHSKPSCATQQNKGERSNPVSKALFQDDR